MRVRNFTSVLIGGNAAEKEALELSAPRSRRAGSRPASMTRSQDAVAQSQTLAAQKSGRQQNDMQDPHVYEDAQATEQIVEEEKFFISSVPLIPDRICSTRNLKAPMVFQT